MEAPATHRGLFLYAFPVAKISPSTSSQIGNLEQALGVRFKDRALLQQAVVHRSYLNEHDDERLKDYERLEFLGDAFLGWVVADELFRRYPSFTEGDLTRARASLVRGSTLARIAGELGVGKHMVLGSGEEATGGRGRRTNLAAVLEALLGAVWLDCGDIEAHRLVLDWLGGAMDSLDPQGAPRDAKSSLQEACQQRGLGLPVYQVTREEGPSHDRHFEVRVILSGTPHGAGVGKRKVDAEQAAAEETLAALDDES